jgi:hypothetical protein
LLFLLIYCDFEIFNVILSFLILTLELVLHRLYVIFKFLSLLIDFVFLLIFWIALQINNLLIFFFNLNFKGYFIFQLRYFFSIALNLFVLFLNRILKLGILLDNILIIRFERIILLINLKKVVFHLFIFVFILKYLLNLVFIKVHMLSKPLRFFNKMLVLNGLFLNF